MQTGGGGEPSTPGSQPHGRKKVTSGGRDAAREVEPPPPPSLRRLWCWLRRQHNYSGDWRDCPHHGGFLVTCRDCGTTDEFCRDCPADCEVCT